MAKGDKWDNDDQIKKMISDRGLTIVSFCNRNGLGTNHFRTSLNRGRFNQKMAEKIAKGLEISLAELVELGATILPGKKKK